MTEALFSITPAGELISARYYTITRDTLNRRIISDELIEEILRRCSSNQVIPGIPGVAPEGDSITKCLAEPRHSDTNWQFTFMDLRVEILKKYEHKIEFFVSRDMPIGESCFRLLVN